MAALSLTGNFLRNSEMEYHGKFRNTFGRIQHIVLMRIIEICYIVCHMVTQTVASTVGVSVSGFHTRGSIEQYKKGFLETFPSQSFPLSL